MFQVIYSPNWFYGKDIIIDFVAVIALALISYFSMRYYRIDKKNKNFVFLSVSFMLLSAAFLSKILTNFTIYYPVIFTKQIGLVTLTYHVFHETNTLFIVGFLLYRLLYLLGLYILYTLYQEEKKMGESLLIIYLIAVSTYFSREAYFIFHITSLILLALICYRYSYHYKNRPTAFGRSLLSAFIVITISHLLSVFIGIDLFFYAIAEIVQLVGYGLLIWTFIKVLMHGKTKPTRHHR